MVGHDEVADTREQTPTRRRRNPVRGRLEGVHGRSGGTGTEPTPGAAVDGGAGNPRTDERWTTGVTKRAPVRAVREPGGFDFRAQTPVDRAQVHAPGDRALCLRTASRRPSGATPTRRLPGRARFPMSPVARSGSRLPFRVRPGAGDGLPDAAPVRIVPFDKIGVKHTSAPRPPGAATVATKLVGIAIKFGIAENRYLTTAISSLDSFSYRKRATGAHAPKIGDGCRCFHSSRLMLLPRPRPLPLVASAIGIAIRVRMRNRTLPGRPFLSSRGTAPPAVLPNTNQTARR